MTLQSLDAAAAAFHDFPSLETAQAYNSLAIHYAAKSIISIEELENILSLIEPYLPTFPEASQ